MTDTDNEAASYRRRLRDTEAQRDALTDRLATLQRAQADQIIESLGIRPQAVWLAGTTLDGLLGDDGDVDPERVQAAAAEAAESLGITPVRQPEGLSGLHSGTMRPPPAADGWVQVFGPPQ